MKIRKCGQDVLSNVEKSIYSYNHAITNLNAKCAEIVGNLNSDIIDVRCVGSNPTNKNSENSAMFSSDELSNYENGKYNGKGKSSDDNYISDYERMLAIGIELPENKDGNDVYYEYWMASRYAKTDAFIVKTINATGLRILHLG